MKCENCVHKDICKLFDVQGVSDKSPCSFFKDQNKFIELPCKVGDRIYEVLFGKVLLGTVIGFRKGKIAGDIEEACESKEWMIEFSNMGGLESSYPISCIGEDLFLTKEAAYTSVERN